MNMLVIGSCSWDKIIHINKLEGMSDDMFLFAKKYYETVGSTGAGKALALKTLGVDVTLVTSFAEDYYGKKIRDFLNHHSIKFVNLPVDQTNVHTNIMHGKGKRLSIATHFPSNEPNIFYDIEKLIVEAEMVYLNINDFARPYIDLIKKHKKKCFVDVHDYDPPNKYHQEFIIASDILVASGVNIENHISFIEKQILSGRELAILTSGEEGLIAYDSKQGFFKISGYNDVVFEDSNGAGDSFCAGLGVALNKGFELKEALLFGSICGGLSCASIELYDYRMNYEEVLKIYKKKSN